MGQLLELAGYFGHKLEMPPTAQTWYAKKGQLQYKLRRAAWQLAGKCLGCGGTRDSDTTTCSGCKARVLTSRKAFWEKHRGRLLQERRQARNAICAALRRSIHLRRNYGLTLIQWEMKFDLQGRRCAICRCDEHRGRYHWHTDHDHITGLVRGILCQACNQAIGFFRDDPMRMSRAIDYVHTYRPRPLRTDAA